MLGWESLANRKQRKVLVCWKGRMGTHLMWVRLVQVEGAAELVHELLKVEVEDGMPL